mmetsp:Transcript_140253/g.391017  ORF Transcript_140253/g.391017 Transcript_140253/m.391017 type:complete len:387 (-) Transcript_140253:176-1336(-)
MRVPHAAVQQRVEDDRVGGEPAIQHLLEDAQGLAHVAIDAMALDNVGVGDSVGLAAILLHARKERRGLLHIAAARLRINQGGVSDEVHLYPLGLHVVVHGHGAVRVAGAGKALDERRVYDRVVAHLRLPLTEEGQCVFDVAGLNERVKHTTQGDVVGRDIAVLHHLPPEVPAALRHLEDAAGLDEQAVRPHGGPDALGLHVGVDGLRQAGPLPAVDAGIEDRVEKHLVLTDVHARAVQDRQCTVGIPRVRGLPGGLHHDGHRVLVHANTPAVHLRQRRPNLGDVSRRDRRADEAVEGGAIGCDAGLLHVGEDAPGLLEVAVGTMALHEGVVGDEVQAEGLLHLLEKLLRPVHLAVHDAGIKGAVIDHDVQALRLRGLKLAEQLQRP